MKATGVNQLMTATRWGATNGAAAVALVAFAALPYVYLLAFANGRDGGCEILRPSRLTRLCKIDEQVQGSRRRTGKWTQRPSRAPAGCCTKPCTYQGTAGLEKCDKLDSKDKKTMRSVRVTVDGALTDVM